MNRKFILFLLAIFLLISDQLNAQSNFEGFSISPKFGAFNSFDEDILGFITGAEASLMNRKWVASTHYYFGHELVVLDASSARYFHQASLLFGINKHFSSFKLEYQAGIAAMWGVSHTEYHSEGLYDGYYSAETYAEPGLVLEVGIEYLAAKYFGLGTQLNVNLNAEMPMIQLAMSFSFGKLR
jgi:hypothetical protein